MNDQMYRTAILDVNSFYLPCDRADCHRLNQAMSAPGMVI